MDRRRFLAALLGGAVLDKDRLLWRPGAKLISIPSVSDYDGPYVVTPTVFAKLKEWEQWNPSLVVSFKNDRWPELMAVRGALKAQAIEWEQNEVIEWERNEQARTLRCDARRYNGCG